MGYIRLGQEKVDSLKKNENQNKKKLKILIFNWRDVKHDYAGGAEVYIDEIAKRWSKDGHAVTMFCGNDGRNPAWEKKNNFEIYRKGGFFTVYLWAFLYYLSVFRGKFDVIVDCSNGVPFFTPLYAGTPKVLLVHHVHRKVFTKYLKKPFSSLAIFIESKIVPILYRNVKTVTVSDSSKEQVHRYSGIRKEQISVVNPGINSKQFIKANRKTKNPSIIYMGRLKKYKNLDIALKSFKKVLISHPQTVMTIAGDGEARPELEELARTLGISSKVKFLGKISENMKKYYLARSWLALQPSSIEGWGITVIEANACRTPVVAFNVGGLKDSIIDGETGVLVEKRTIKGYSETISDMISNPQIINKLSNGSYQWASSFSWDASSQIFYEILEKEITGIRSEEVTTPAVIEIPQVSEEYSYKLYEYKKR